MAPTKRTHDDRSTIEASVRGVALPPQLELSLVIAGSGEEPERVGEVAFIALGTQVLGRGGARPDDGAPRLEFLRQRPSSSVTSAPLSSSRLSRTQLRLVAASGSDQLQVENVGRCPLFVNGVMVREARVGVADTLRLQNELLLLVVRRPRQLPAQFSGDTTARAFGEPDAHGLVGESPAAWRLRQDIAFAAASPEHVLVRGESGTGKELVVGAIHALSGRGNRPLVSRNAATLPEGLVDAELFGNMRNYPNPGMPEREGLIGQAHGGTLFLDEIGELPLTLQAHLLRVLDRGGEYQRLGDTRPRVADIRIVAATNREVAALKHDFAARLTLRVEVPSLEQRREDIPLLVRHLLNLIAQRSPSLTRRFIESNPQSATPRVALTLLDALLRARYRTHARQLEQLLWTALRESVGDELSLTERVSAALAAAELDANASSGSLPPVGSEDSVSAPLDGADRDPDVSRADLVAALAANGASATRTARALGLKNRFAVYRAMKKYGLETGQEKPEE